MSVYAKERPEYLREALDSVFAQTRPADEVVVVEDGPLTPELYAVLEAESAAHRELRRAPLAENHGLGYALNHGLTVCTHDLVARMDSDDISHPDRFARQTAYMEAHPETDICSSWIDEFEGQPSNVVSQRRVPETHEEILRYAKGRCPVNHPAVVYRRGAVQRCGGYYGFPEDLYLWVRMLMGGCRFHNLQESLLHFRFSRAVYARRGGWSYAVSELKAHWLFYRIGWLTAPEFARVASIRFAVRVVPVGVRSWVYKKLLRKREARR